MILGDSHPIVLYKTHQASRLNQKKNKRLKVIITVHNEITGKKMVWSAHVILFQEKEKPPQSPTSWIFYLNKHQTSTALAAFLAFPLKKKKRSLTCKEVISKASPKAVQLFIICKCGKFSGQYQKFYGKAISSFSESFLSAETKR